MGQSLRNVSSGIYSIVLPPVVGFMQLGRCCVQYSRVIAVFYHYLLWSKEASCCRVSGRGVSHSSSYRYRALVSTNIAYSRVIAVGNSCSKERRCSIRSFVIVVIVPRFVSKQFHPSIVSIKIAGTVIVDWVQIDASVCHFTSNTFLPDSLLALVISNLLLL